MIGPSYTQFISADKNQTVYKIAVFTVASYKKIIAERGSSYVFDLFMEVCKERNCRFLGLKSENGYMYAILGFDLDKNYGQNRKSNISFWRGDCAC